MMRAIYYLPDSKRIVPDQISAELVKVGGAAMGVTIRVLMKYARQQVYAPLT